MKTALIILSALLLMLTTGCGKSEGGDAAAPAAAPGGDKAEAAKAAKAPTKGAEALTDAQMVAIGERLYKVQGGNTCNDCHGVAGHSGRLQQAADLRKPQTWKAFKATGGDMAKFEERIVSLIKGGAGVWNAAHPDDLYDVNMMGVTQGATKKEVKKIRKELKKKDGITIAKGDADAFAAKAAYSYVKTLAIKGDAPATAGAEAPAGVEAKPAEGDAAKPAEGK